MNDIYDKIENIRAKISEKDNQINAYLRVIKHLEKRIKKLEIEIL